MFLLEYLVIIVKKLRKKPLLSITPIPIKIIKNILNGAKLTKLDTVLLNIYFNPDKLNKDSTSTFTVSNSKVLVLTLLYEEWTPNIDNNPLKIIVIKIKTIKILCK